MNSNVNIQSRNTTVHSEADTHIVTQQKGYLSCNFLANSNGVARWRYPKRNVLTYLGSIGKMIMVHTSTVLYVKTGQLS